MKAKDVVQRLKAEGWQEVPGSKTGHRHFKHPTHPGKVTVPMHGGDIPPGTLGSIGKQAGIKF